MVEDLDFIFSYFCIKKKLWKLWESSVFLDQLLLT